MSSSVNKMMGNSCPRHLMQRTPVWTLSHTLSLDYGDGHCSPSVRATGWLTIEARLMSSSLATRINKSICLPMNCLVYLACVNCYWNFAKIMEWILIANLNFVMFISMLEVRQLGSSFSILCWKQIKKKSVWIFIIIVPFLSNTQLLKEPVVYNLLHGIS